MPIPPFVVELREHIGHRSLWLPGVTAVVLRGSEVLLVQRSDDLSWAPVTGIVDPGEHPATAALREVLEETGVECAVERLAWVNVSPPITHRNGDLAQYLDHTFRCSFLSGEPYAADDESLDAAWVDMDALPPMRAQLRERILTARDGVGTRLD